jgi:dTDP-D-glucose 4,6-dehydratase
MSNRTILITGGAGFIGSHVVRLFVNKYPDYRIINLDKLTYAGNLANLKDIEDRPNYRFVKMDICDFEGVLALMKEEHVDGVIHLAAESHVDRSIKDPFTFAQTNVIGTLSMLQAAKAYWEPMGYVIPSEAKEFIPCRFYHISTDEVYGALEMTHPEGIEPPFTTKASSGEHHLAYGEKFFTEDLKYQPHSPYSAAKASSDHFVRAFHDTYGMPTIVTNCSNNYGPYQFPEKLIPLFVNNIRHRKPLPVYGKGENVRDWLYVEDHARAIDLIFHEGKVAETYNIGGFNEWKNIDIVKTLIRVTDRLLGRPEGADDDLITYVTDRAGHDLRYAIDSTKLQRELGWEPSLQFEEGIEKTIKWYLENQAWLDNVTSGDYQKYYEEMYKGR